MKGRKASFIDLVPRIIVVAAGVVFALVGAVFFVTAPGGALPKWLYLLFGFFLALGLGMVVAGIFFSRKTVEDLFSAL
jgi:hypothetical protein